MYRVECVEQILEAPNPGASLIVVEIKKHKAGEGVVFCAEKAQLDKACHDIERELRSENIEDKDKADAETMVISIELLGGKDAKSKRKTG